MNKQRNELYRLIFDKFSAEPEFLWEDAPDAAVFRHYDNRKWFAIIMSVKAEVLGLKEQGKVDVINIKINPLDIYELLQVENIIPAYHMNKKHWVSIILDRTVKLSTIEKLLEGSYELTKSKKFKKAK